MGFYNNLCPGCMNEIGDEKICPYCGFDALSRQTAPFLAYGTVLAGKYVVGDILEQNSEGVTYIGLDTITNNCVRIREFLPDVLCTRAQDEVKIRITGENAVFKTYLRDYLDLWHKVMRLKTLDTIITVLDVFEANDTAYAVAEADGSQTLSDFIDENGGRLGWQTITDRLFPVLDSIQALNEAGIIHGAISPDTLFLCSDGTFKLWGFGIKETKKLGGYLGADIRPGYAAVEQYDNEKKLSAATDIYGFACVLYRCVTGITPADAEIRSREDTLTIPAVYARELSDFVLAAFIVALQVEPSERTPDVKALKASFTKEAFEIQKKQAAAASTISLIDPISDIDSDDYAPKKEPKTVILNESPSMPVVKKEEPVKTANSAASTIMMSVSIVFVMLIFFVCLALTGIISFNFGSGSTAKVVEMPNFENYAKSDAYIVDFANKYGLQITLQPASSDTVAQDVIFGQNIAAGTKIARGSEIILTYSKGCSTVTLPNFTGMTVTETVYYLGKLNLSYNIIEKSNPGGQSAGSVASMTPAAGSVVYEGTEINIEIWGDSSSSGDITGGNTGSQVTSSDSIIDSIVGSLSDSVSGLSDTIQNFF